MNIDNKLQKLYYNTKTGFTSSNKLYKQARKNNIDVTQKQINEFLNNQSVVQLFKEIKKPKEFSSIVAKGIKDEYQMDIMIYDRYEYNKYKYILVIIDIHSRYAEARAMTNRNNTTIMDNIKSIFNTMGKPKIIACDNEFNTNEFNKYCVDNNISVRFSEPNEIQKNSIVERFNRTLAGYLKKIRESLKVYDWARILNDVIYNYNNTYHRTIKNTPTDIFKNKGDNNQDVKIIPRVFKVGDKVRLKLKKKIFDKGDILYYSKDIYIIKEITTELNVKKYLLSNDKYYQGKDLMKINDIKIYEPDELDEREEEEFKQTKKAIDQDKKLNRVGIDKENITNEKRIPKPNVKYL